MNYLDLFSGIGGFHLGLLQAGFKFEWVGHSEIDKYAKQIHKKHFPESEDLGDVKTIRVDKLPRLNLITFGFPCQDLSIAGKRAGLKGKRSGLFDEAIRIIQSAKPDYFIFENVKGLFSSNEGRDFEYCLRTIAGIGYDGQWQLLNTRWFLPQNRERIYFVGHIRGQSRPKVFPIGKSNQVDTEDGIKKVIDTGHQGNTIYSTNGNAVCFTGLGGGQGAKTGLYEVKIPTNTKLGYDVAIEKEDGIRLQFEESKTARGRVVKGASQSLQTSGQVGVLDKMKIANTVTPDAYLANGKRKRDESGKAVLTSMHERRIRRLTPKECERLQGFPDNFTKGISDTQRYKTLGNAVSIPVVKAVGERLLTHIERNP